MLLLQDYVLGSVPVFKCKSHFGLTMEALNVCLGGNHGVKDKWD